MRIATSLAEHGWLPDPVIGIGIRGLLRERLHEERHRSLSGQSQAFLDSLPGQPLAIDTAKANEQHYKVPAAYFSLVLGPRRKYSACLYEAPQTSLAEAEEAMLALTAERAQIEDGLHILDLGCGWGSLSLWLAERFPHARITGVSNSHGQRRYIEEECHLRGLTNVSILTADINTFVPPRSFDRVVSIEMFEHLRNHDRMLRKVRQWLRPGGSAFVHIFCHREHAYPYETDGDNNWMGQHFFTGGMMPSYDLLTRYPDAMRVEERWQVNGSHYHRTCMDWLARHDACRKEVLQIFTETYGPKDADLWFNRWRLFYLGCAELFRYNNGEEWFVGHYRLSPG